MSRQNKMRWELLGILTLVCLPAAARAQDRAPKEQPATPTADKTAKPLAVVNGEVISTTDLELAMQQAGPSPVALTQTQSKQIKMDILRLLIDASLMRQFLTKNAPPASAAEIDKKLAEVAEGLKKQNKTLADHLRESHETEAMLRTNVGYALMWEHYAESRIAEADVRRYYTEFKDFFDGITVRASHIVLRVAPNAPPAEISAAKAKLTALRAELLGKKTEFAAAAKAHSHCPSKDNGGDIGYITRKWGMVDEAFARAAFSVPPGQISDVVQTEFGLHLILVTDRKAGQPSDYAKIKDDVRQFYTEETRLNLIAEQRKAAKLEVNLNNLP